MQQAQFKANISGQNLMESKDEFTPFTLSRRWHHVEYMVHTRLYGHKASSQLLDTILAKALRPPLSALGSVCPGLYGDYWEICIQPSSSLWLLENGDALSPLQNPPMSLVCPNLPSDRCRMQSVCRVQVSISVLCGEDDCACGSLACTLPEELLMPLHVSRAAGEKRQLWGGIGFLSYSKRNLHVSCGWTISWPWSGSTEINGRSVVNHNEYWTRPGGRLSLSAGQS